MPMYEFVCGKHGAYEAQLPIARRDEGICPDCGIIGTRVLFHPNGHSVDPGKPEWTGAWKDFTASDRGEPHIDLETNKVTYHRR